MPHFDAVIVGSGFGGASTASKLATAGMRVLVLERGPWWGATGAWGDPDRHRNFPTGVLGARRTMRGVRLGTDRISRSVRFRTDGLYELHQFNNLSCMVASGVGGGSLVYTNMMVAPPVGHFDDAYPAEVAASDMDRYIVEVRHVLNPTPDVRPHRKAEAFTRAAAATGDGTVTHPDLAIDFDGADGGAADHPCLLGSPDLSKQSMDNTYLRKAANAGATIQALCEVEAITPPNDNGGWQVRYRDLDTGRAHVVAANRVVLAAGTLGTLRLLFTARDAQQTLPLIGSALGRNFTPNGDVASLVYGSGYDIKSGTGPSITAFQQVVGQRTYLTGEFGLPLRSLPRPLRGRLSKSTVLFSMGADHIAAEMRWRDGNLHCDVGRSDDLDLYDNIAEHATRIGSGYNSKRVLANAPFGPRSNRLFTVHPVGGLPMGSDPIRHVIDHAGQVHNYPGLFVADGAVLQKAPGIPPSLTIAALAARQADLMTQP